MKTQRYYPYLWALLLALATFSLACGSNNNEETTDTSDNVMYTAADAEDANYDNEVTVDQATPFNAETATASEESTASRDFGTQPGAGETQSEDLEYFSNEYKKAYSTSTTDQRAIVPGYDEAAESGNTPPYGTTREQQTATGATEKTKSATAKNQMSGSETSATDTDPAGSTPQEYDKTATDTRESKTSTTSSTRNKTAPTRAEWSREDNPTDYVKPDTESPVDTEPSSDEKSTTDPDETSDAMTTADWREQAADRYLEETRNKDAMAETAPIVYDPTIYTIMIWNTEAMSDEWPYGEPAYRNLSALDAPPLFEEECMNELGYDARMECSHDALETYLYERSNYPEEAREEKNEAMAYVTFVLDEQGQVVPASAELSGYEGNCTACKDEALRLVREMPQWENPAYLNGRAVATQITVPVRFIVRIND